MCHLKYKWQNTKSDTEHIAKKPNGDLAIHKTLSSVDLSIDQL